MSDTSFPLERHPFEHAAETHDRLDRLARVAPRVTYVILCWEGETWAKDEEYADVKVAPGAILGPYTEREARATAATLTCECEVTMVSTSPPLWATQGVSPGAGPAHRIR
jgi:hypothetical protein